MSTLDTDAADRTTESGVATGDSQVNHLEIAVIRTNHFTLDIQHETLF